MDHLEQVHLVEIEAVGPQVVGTVLETVLRSQESPLHLTLFQGLAKGDKMDFVVQKAVELGAAEIVPFSSYHTVVKLGEKQQEAKGHVGSELPWKRPSRVNVRAFLR